ncbi:RmlC-like cupin domain-containing protein [Lophiotrema nucula]|uniref:RmlC-like cupin domain-containing protein n=1 Tax=Lophiotrema nucula TaxID=690887 RepID=A0A6A5YS74_9PLEO|nr:RmlC-like cupin domain-containing protein [Lophiotrema nucula]
MPNLTLTPLASLRYSTHHIPSHSLIPNTSPHSHPLLIYHSVYPPTTSPSAIEAHLPKNGVSPQWRYTMYSTTHYHSTTHEVLCVFKGRAKLLFGGESNPSKLETQVSAGDAIIVPAGVGHRLLEDYDSGFQMVGSYPKGCKWDMCYGNAGEEAKADAVKDVKWFEKDPLYGDDGPALWKHDEAGKSEL